MSNTESNKPAEGRVELPLVVPENTNRHFSSLLIDDGLAQVADHLKTIEDGIADINKNAQKLNESMQQLQTRRISIQAQNSLLLELKRKLEEFEGANNPR